MPGVLTQTVRPVLEFRLHLQLEAGLVTSVLQPYREQFWENWIALAPGVWRLPGAHRQLRLPG